MNKAFVLSLRVNGKFAGFKPSNVLFAIYCPCGKLKGSTRQPPSSASVPDGFVGQDYRGNRHGNNPKPDSE